MDQTNRSTPRPIALDEFEFEQYSLSVEGRCVPLVAKWLAEKRDTSNGLGARFRRVFGGEDRQFVRASLDGSHNRRLFDSVADSQGRYGQANDHEAVFREFGFTSITEVRSPIDNPDVNNVIVDAAANLARGRGICIFIAESSDAPGHAVAIHCSRGGNLHFFDPNRGVYKLFDAAAFLREWRLTYEEIGVHHYLEAGEPALIYVL